MYGSCNVNDHNNLTLSDSPGSMLLPQQLKSQITIHAVIYCMHFLYRIARQNVATVSRTKTPRRMSQVISTGKLVPCKLPGLGHTFECAHILKIIEVLLKCSYCMVSSWKVINDFVGKNVA